MLCRAESTHPATLGSGCRGIGSHLFDCWKLGALLRLGHAHAAFVPRLFALLQGSVAELTTATQDKRQRPLLLRRGLEFVFEGLPHHLRVHNHLFRLIGTKTARGKGHSSPT